MLCKMSIARRIRWIMVAVGIVSIVFSIYTYIGLPEDEHDLIMLMGMFTGFGAAFLVLGIINVIKTRRMTREQLKQEEIERNDERTVAVNGKAYTVSSIITSVFLAVSAFALVGLGYRVAAYIVIGGLYLQIISLLVATRYFQKRM